MTWLWIVGALLALVVGVWIGLGAPGWPHRKPLAGSPRRRLEKRDVNPISWNRRPRGTRERRRR